jgi:anti-sigma factor RsiW
MNCKIYKELLHSYVGNELNPFEREEMDKHLEGCLSCRRAYEEILQLKRIAAELKPQGFQLTGLKAGILAAITPLKPKVPTYDIKVVWRLGASLVACGVLALYLNFSSAGILPNAEAIQENQSIKQFGQKLSQPFAALHKGLSDMSDGIFNLNGISIRIEKKNRGGM